MQTAASRNDWALVLAGGDGKRLQSLTRRIAGAPIPKQYCRLLGDRSLLEATLARIRPFAPLERTLVVVNRDHLVVGQEQLARLPGRSLLAQPANRDTGSGITLALLHLADRSQALNVVVFPSDHYVHDDRAFMAHVDRAARLVDRFPTKIAMLGVRPDTADPTYGYIAPGRPLRAGSRACAVRSFVEKPCAAVAADLLAEGALWNSFVMVFRLERMLDLLQRLLPAEFDRLCAIQHDPSAADALFGNLRPWNFSTRVLARIPEHLIVLPVDDVHWADWGTPESVERTLRALKKDPGWTKPGRAGIAA